MSPARAGCERPVRRWSLRSGTSSIEATIFVVSPPLKVCPGQSARRHLTTGGQVGERPDNGMVADLGVVTDGVADDSTGAHYAVDQMRIGADLGSAGNTCAALQQRSRVEGDVDAELDGGVEVGALRVE